MMPPMMPPNYGMPPPSGRMPMPQAPPMQLGYHQGMQPRAGYADEQTKQLVNSYGRESYPLHAEENHMGWDSDVVYYNPEVGVHMLDPEPGLARTIVKLPHSRYVGSPEFIDGVPKRNSTFAWTEICASREPECSLAPVPQVPMKSWYNTYIYVPEQRSHVERQYLERFVPGPDGEWLDVVKARRMNSFLIEERQAAELKREEQKKVQTGEVVELTDYVDSYTGEHLVACNNQLMSKKEVYERYNIHKSDWGKKVDALPGFDFDNLRTPWPGGTIDRNKGISQHAYDWFDRRNPHVVSDRSYRMMELPSFYVDEDMYNKWRATGDNSLLGQADDVATRAGYPVDDYPYRM